MYDANLFDVPIGLYTTTKKQTRLAYENRVKGFKNDKEYTKNRYEMMKKASKEIDFDIDIAQSDARRYAFTETLRQIAKQRIASRVIVCTYTLDGQFKYFTLGNNTNLETTIGHISGEVDLLEDQSDVNPVITNGFYPVRYEVMFLKKNQHE